ncbi:hypothetical protein KJ742_00435 [Patescibacteria group bacterium]|nr:hypothetical protein [Patescibacteria group bacterium]MBU1682391.1 hypothetical protein [Patescibacteria group bacterium]MBU1934807.1 hypothetical protein [Patescibacteria group bacterium]
MSEKPVRQKRGFGERILTLIAGNPPTEVYQALPCHTRVNVVDLLEGWARDQDKDLPDIPADKIGDFRDMCRNLAEQANDKACATRGQVHTILQYIARILLLDYDDVPIERLKGTDSFMQLATYINGLRMDCFTCFNPECDKRCPGSCVADVKARAGK